MPIKIILSVILIPLCILIVEKFDIKFPDNKELINQIVDFIARGIGTFGGILILRSFFILICRGKEQEASNVLITAVGFIIAIVGLLITAKSAYSKPQVAQYSLLSKEYLAPAALYICKYLVYFLPLTILFKRVYRFYFESQVINALALIALAGTLLRL
ncbi:hypothetical protein [Bacillus sp. EAC]|uniref:hypothetical protein n=1 Tax=Bacillus sp. EAC TaxID=1978338 RepID=UPI000B43691A|nr:hypothetical protein [Bacillus sp. EAC]